MNSWLWDYKGKRSSAHLVNAQVVHEEELRVDHVIYGQQGERCAIRLTSNGVDGRRPTVEKIYSGTKVETLYIT